MTNANMVTDSISPSTQTYSRNAKFETTTVTFDSVMTEEKELLGTRTASILQDEEGLEMVSYGLILPNRSNMEELTSRLEDSLSDFMREHGISNDPPVEITYDYNSNKVKVTGEGANAAELEEAINADEVMKEDVRTVNAIASHYVALAESIEFHYEYLNSDDPEAVVRKYSHLFNDNRSYPVPSLRFGSDGLTLLADGKPFEHPEWEEA